MPSNASLRLQRRFQQELGTREEAQQRFCATTGDGTGNIEVPGKRNYVYIRRVGRSRVEECHNTKVPRRNNLHVIVGYDPTNPDTLQVLEPDWGGMASPDNYPYVPYHHESHEFQNADGGDDVTWIQSQQYVPLLAYPTDPTSMTVNVYGGWYCWGTDWHYFEAAISADLTGSIPGIVGNARYTLISIDGATEALQYTDGAEFPAALPPADIEDMIPVAPGGSVPIVAVCLQNGMVSIDWADLYDIRMMVATAGMVVPHAQLSHTDSVPAAPVQGDLIVGNATPAWARFGRGTVHQLLKMNVAATDPVWAAFDWDDMAAAAGADMVHDHSAAGEGGDELTPSAIGVGTAIPDQDGAIAMAETADPTNVVGVGMSYFKDDAGQTKQYFEDDAGHVFEVAGIVEDLTVTVGGGGDFATIQDAVDWFKNWIVKGTCYIDCDAGAYDEAVVFTGLLIAPGATLTLQGDTRVLAGLSYVDGATMNRGGLANGGSGTCSLTTDGTRTVITVTGSTTSPDFDADNWVNGDRVLCFCDNGSTYERVIGAALNNAITITVALPVGATLGNDGTAIALVPNRSVERTVAGPCISVDACRGIAIDGWYLQPTTGAGCDGLLVINNAFVTATNTLAQAEDTGFACYSGYAFTNAIDGACSAWDCAIGYYVAQASQVDVRYSVAVHCTTGYYCYGMSWMYAYRAVASTCTTYDYRAVVSGAIYAVESIARLGGTGYWAGQQGYILATTTNANNTATTPYNPTPTDAWGNNNGSITFS